ncbi:Heavy-metal-associated domain-containing protein [Sporobacter termitidis DSM 10068]|uniref:Heavy-metal-associated domain-containing protein n=1 Tax=Sporobacter termitidis DSM 10068 TaxID=1123282 RepID=A0A1M5XUB5_9FIRM|nr:heavy metal-associated domain-containing protein [Sporobacter termitidis]SHI03312.1 Heavy-metal-associated domain-containing protein [Sporobacter termitidis DSM 10068]
MSTTKKYILEGLCCTNCAAAIEREVGQAAGIKKAAVDFETTSITVEFDGDESGILKAVTDISTEIDEDIVVKAV